ncbi:MAG: hypothetical protein QM690_17990 [Sphingobium sp.]
MSAATLYRQNAAAQRAAAGKESLPRRRQQHERSAERWEEMARAAEETERRTAINDVQKRARNAA